MEFCESRISVRYAETDAMAFVHHSNYIVWFEIGRMDWMLAQGHNYADFEKKGYYLVVSEVGVRYLKPARYGHDVILRTSATDVKSRSIRFEYEVRHAETDERLVTGFTCHILINHEGKVRRFPPEVMALLK